MFVDAILIRNWKRAYHFCILNAALFLALSLWLYLGNVQTRFLILIPPLLYFIGTLVSFILMTVWGCGALASVNWYVLGTGIFFGLGAFVGGIPVTTHATYLFSNDTSYLVNVHLMNSISILIVLIFAYYQSVYKHGFLLSSGWATGESKLLNIYSLLSVFAWLGILIKFIYFPIAESLLLRSIFDKLFLLLPAYLLISGLIWSRLNYLKRMTVLFLIILYLLNGFLSLSKYQMIVGLLAFYVGFWIKKTNFKFMILSLVSLGLLFFITTPIINLARSHIEYNSNGNTLVVRKNIVWDVLKAKFSSHQKTIPTIDANQITTLPVESYTSFTRIMASIGARFDVITMQGYLMREFDSGRKSDSLKEFWAIFVPRVFWKEKPIMNRHGIKLNKDFYSEIDPSVYIEKSSSAPTYTGEAYWNLGWTGVILISILIGLCNGLLTNLWQKAITGSDVSYFFISYSATFWAFFVESWIVATYLGDFVVLICSLILIKCMFHIYEESLFYSKRSQL